MYRVQARIVDNKANRLYILNKFLSGQKLTVEEETLCRTAYRPNSSVKQNNY